MKGFTLVELLTVVLIFVLILGGTFTVLTMGRRSWQIGTAQIDAQQEARRAMDVMIRELRGASAVDPSTFINGVSTDFIRFTLGGQTIEFTVSNNQLLRNPVATPPVLGNDIDSVEFNLLGGNMIYIILTTQRQSNPGRTVTATLSSQVVLRN